MIEIDKFTFKDRWEERLISQRALPVLNFFKLQFSVFFFPCHSNSNSTSCGVWPN